MLKWLGSLVDSNEKELKRLQPMVDAINGLESEFTLLSDAALAAKTAEFKERLAKATAYARERRDEATREVNDARLRASEAPNDLARDECESECKRLQSRAEQAEKELREDENRALNELLPEAFATVREAARRTIKQRHFDVQLIGGIVLHQGKIAEMKTGEGKTLVATLPLYLNSLTRRGVHLVTVNDYLSRRDAYWMGPVFHALGVTVASIFPQTAAEYTPSRLYDPAFDSGEERWRHFRPITRREAYQADITYGTCAEFGFDYLRDNMVIDLGQCVQRTLNYAIVDEVDNLLIDEARTPLIISGPAEDAGQLYRAVDDVASRMKVKTLPHMPSTQEEKDELEVFRKQYDYISYEKERHVEETTMGQEKIARAFRLRVEDLFGGEKLDEEATLAFEDAKRRNDIRHIFRQSMAAHALYQRDRDYMIRDGERGPEVIIVDEFTGRLMIGRRFSEGLHQAIEAKERVKVQQESKTYGTVTIQNYFRMYQKLSGMTGTAVTEAEEFHKIYKLEVVAIPTNKPMVRTDNPDRIYKDEKTKFQAAAREIEELHRQGRPVLIGTVSIEKSEMLGNILKRKGVPHQVLNAKLHEKEASIIAQAGRPGAVTVATNMAGRGVDIILGGNPEDRDPREWQAEHDRVVGVGGLHIIGTERHEARRIDNQLRGRAGRQGDPGGSRFYVSLEDDVVRRFGGDRIKGLMEWAGMDENTPIENNLVSKAIENAQVKVEGYHFDMRKHLVEYDDVVNKQRELIYSERQKILCGADLKANILYMVEKEIGALVASHVNEEGGPHLEGILPEAGAIFPLPVELNAASLTDLKAKEIEEKLAQAAQTVYGQREKELGTEAMRVLERLVMLRVMDNLWVEHLTTMEEMRLQAGWRSLEQMKSTDAYKVGGFQKFQELLAAVQHEVAHTIYHVGIVKQEAPRPVPVGVAAGRNTAGSRMPLPNRAIPAPPQRVAGKKVGRNDPCPCGSGKKYKVCCGK